MCYHGSCNCGAVHYQVHGDLSDVVYCHCQLCQKMSGSAFLAFGSALHQQLQIFGHEAMQSYQATMHATRYFCRHCGSNLFWQPQGEYGDTYQCIALGTLDTPFEPRKWQHFYTDQKACWFEIQDEQRCYATCP
ncbi:hypothetical protein VST7929_01514 [Vibrio stylophorae]|uniref:CENP-V/GFA domain-containing protein n=1 Tax=Vibrio stylophorae TaxID=659351 RepID=A0ABM8ZTK5_9VIBR|nr:GFA family protein [Vibrio stylophorae]CAH0533643.1 hypothetical protein VST7929_01514 [Vibrio stylophorae]